MGYPVITRLGLSQFWYRHWYANSNSSYFMNFKQDLIFTHLFKMYLNYGLTFSNTLFMHEHFFNYKYRNIRLNLLLKNLRYFRRFYFSNYNLGIEHSYFLRYKTGEYFPLRLWIIKYSNWLIICFNCFKPIKQKFSKKITTKKEFYSISPSLNFNKNNQKFYRFKLIFLYLQKSFFKKSFNYFF